MNLNKPLKIIEPILHQKYKLVFKADFPNSSVLKVHADNVNISEGKVFMRGNIMAMSINGQALSLEITETRLKPNAATLPLINEFNCNCPYWKAYINKDGNLSYLAIAYELPVKAIKGNLETWIKLFDDSHHIDYHKKIYAQMLSASGLKN